MPAKSQPKLEKLVRRLRGRRIGVLGDFMLDRYVWGTANRLSPEAAVPVVDFVSETTCLGGAGNVAANLAALGAEVIPFGVIGTDKDSDVLKASLAERGMTLEGMVRGRQRTTTVKTRIVARSQQIVRIDREESKPLAPQVQDSLVRVVKSSLPRLDALVVSDYDKGVISDALADRVLDECRRLGIPALVKPKTSRLFAYRGATAIVCNSKEAGFFVTSQLTDDESIQAAGEKLLAHFGCAAVVITMGSRGLSVFEEGAPKRFHVSATGFEVDYGRVGLPGVDAKSGGRQVFDVTGAGDTVLALLALGVAAEASIRDAAILANLAAGVVVGKLGTATVTPEELSAAVAELG